MSEPASKKKIKIACSSCGQHLDVTELPAFSRAFCPACNTKLLVPMVIGNYQLLSPMGSGGMGTVYKAFDSALQRFVAVKLMKKELASNAQFVADFTREARAAASLNHPNIAQILSFGRTDDNDGQYYIVMELLEGGSLDHMIETHKRVAELDVLNIGIQVASALKAAYQRGVIHRDIKPGNILFNSESQAKVVDFGLAQFAGAEEEKKQEDGIWGTPYYIAPEKLNGEREDFRSDMYSIGGTMFHALAGRPPFEANTATEVVLKHLREPALSLKTFAPDICDKTAQAIGCMLRKNREDRYPDYDELIDDLEEAKRAAVAHQRELANKKRKPQARAAAATKPAASTGSWKGVVATLTILAACIACGYFVWAKREVLFRSSDSASSAGTATQQQQPAQPAAEQSWLDLWDAADNSLIAGKYQPAIDAYRKARQKLNDDPPRQCILDCQIGAALYLLGKPEDARKAFSAAGEKMEIGIMPEKINQESFGPLLGQLISGGFTLDQIQSSLKQQMPAALALAQFYLGVQALGEGKLAECARFFDTYTTARADLDPRWVTLYQPHAKSIAAQIRLQTQGIEEATKLIASNKAEEAYKKITAIKAQVKHPLLQSPFAAIDTAIAGKSKELADMEHARKVRERFALDKQSLEQVDATVDAAINDCNFDTLAKAYAAAAEKMGSPAVKQAAEDRAMVYQRLTALKTLVIEGIAKTPYARNDLATRANARLAGAVTKADAEKIVVSVKDRPDQATPWRDLAPASVVALFITYDTLATSLQPAEHGANYVAIAWFAQTQHLDQTLADTYMDTAVKFAAVSRNEWDRFNAPLAGDATPGTPTVAATGKKSDTDVDFDPVKKKPAKK
ncbi:MAG: serine/threonine-protein kinase [Verrucomicrobia bacterium]|nr:serine/threonine-protein kinase [Verrucomicrobiota bacterium]